WSLRLRADVTGLRPNQPIYSLLLEYVRGPSGHAPHREEIGETVARNLERLEHERRIELDIRVETPPGPVLPSSASASASTAWAKRMRFSPPRRAAAVALSTSARGSRTR